MSEENDVEYQGLIKELKKCKLISESCSWRFACGGEERLCRRTLVVVGSFSSTLLWHFGALRVWG